MNEACYLESIPGGERYPLSGADLIGRSESCSIVFPEASVSRRHAELKNIDGIWAICDLGSSNGVFVNGAKLRSGEPRRLQDGDRISLGSKVTLRFVIPTPAFTDEATALAPEELLEEDEKEWDEGTSVMKEELSFVPDPEGSWDDGTSLMKEEIPYSESFDVTRSEPQEDSLPADGPQRWEPEWKMDDDDVFALEAPAAPKAPEKPELRQPPVQKSGALKSTVRLAEPVPGAELMGQGPEIGRPDEEPAGPRLKEEKDGSKKLSFAEYLNTTGNLGYLKSIVTAAVLVYVSCGITAAYGLATETYTVLIDIGVLLPLALIMHLKKSFGCAIALLCVTAPETILSLAVTGSIGGFLPLIGSIFAVIAFSRARKGYQSYLSGK